MRPVLLRTIVATTDLDDASLVALEVAHRLMAIAGAKLHIVHVPPNSTSGGPLAGEEPPTELADKLNDILRKARVSPDDVRTHIIPGPPAETIRAAAERLQADVIVLGAHRKRATANAQLGSTALAVVTESAMPCLVVSDVPLRLPLEKILVPIDGSDTARGALLVGLSWASALRKPTAEDEEPKTTLMGLHVVADAGNSLDRAALDEELNTARENAGSWAGVSIAGEIISQPNVARAIIDRATEKKFDLVVLGTRGQGLDDRERLGAVPTEVVQSLKMPVLLVSHAVWRSYADAD